MPIQHWSENIWVAALAEEPAFSEELSQLRDEMACAEPAPHVVIDLTAVRRVNSSNISQLLRVRKLAIDREVKLRLTAPSDPVWAVFLTTGLDKVFEFAPHVSVALATLQMET